MKPIDIVNQAVQKVANLDFPYKEIEVIEHENGSVTCVIKVSFLPEEKWTRGYYSSPSMEFRFCYWVSPSLIPRWVFNMPMNNTRYKVGQNPVKSFSGSDLPRSAFVREMSSVLKQWKNA